jgi:hypothetical protein
MVKTEQNAPPTERITQEITHAPAAELELLQK